VNNAYRRSMTAALLAALLLVALGAAPVGALAAVAIPTTTYDGWRADMDGKLLTDSEGYYVLTVTPQMAADGDITLQCNRFARLFLKDFRNISNTDTTYKMKIVNASGKTITYRDYAFTTHNVLPRTDNIFGPATGAITDSPELGRGLGSAYAAMLPTILTAGTYTDLCIDTQGFDGNNMNLMMVPLRCTNDAICSFYGVDHTFDVTLPQIMHLDENLAARGYSSYAHYLKSYYGVASLSNLPPATVYNILGTTNGAQSAITNWRDNTIGGKPIPASELGSLTNEFRIWGLLHLNGDSRDAAQYPYVPNFFMMETDPEVLQLAYDYLYTDGLRFSFDQLTQPFDTTDNEHGRGGDFGIKAYVNKSPGSTAHVNSVFGGVTLADGDELKLDNVTAGLYVPNAWNQYRLYDFGFNLIFTTDEVYTLAITKTGRDLNGPRLVPGDVIEWRIVVRNTGPTVLTNVEVVDDVPSTTAYVPGSITGRGADDSASRRLRWLVGTLNPGESVTLTFRSTVNAGLPNGTEIRNQAAVHSDQVGWRYSDDSSTPIPGDATLLRTGGNDWIWLGVTVAAVLLGLVALLYGLLLKRRKRKQASS